MIDTSRTQCHRVSHGIWDIERDPEQEQEPFIEFCIELIQGYSANYTKHNNRDTGKSSKVILRKLKTTRQAADAQGMKTNDDL